MTTPRAYVLFLLAVALGGASAAAPGAEGGGCGVFFGEMRRAYGARLAERAADVLRRAEHAHVCSGGQLRLLGEQAALTAYGAAFASGVTDDERMEILKKALRLGRPWQALAALGDVLTARGDFAGAAGLFAEALDNAGRTAPKVRGMLRRKMVFSALLAPGVRPVVMRCGQPAGKRPGAGKDGAAAVMAMRGCAGADIRPLPVPFGSASARLSRRGAAFAALMLAWARRRGAKRLVLTGYADPRGDRRRNLRLALARARAVRRYFRAHGFRGVVVVRAGGEIAPPAAPPAVPRAVTMRASRRVEIRIEEAAGRGGGAG